MKTIITCQDVLQEILLPVELMFKNCRIERFQGSGAGGQKRNRVYSAVRLRHLKSDTVAECQEYRESQRNLDIALQRLRVALVLNLKREAFEVWIESMGDTENNLVFPELILAALKIFRVPCNPLHFDYPICIWDLYFALVLHQGELQPGAKLLKCSASALVRLCKQDKGMWQLLKNLRKGYGLSELK